MPETADASGHPERIRADVHPVRLVPRRQGALPLGCAVTAIPRILRERTDEAILELFPDDPRGCSRRWIGWRSSASSSRASARIC